MRETHERRREIIEHLCIKRSDTIANLSRLFNVSRSTIIRDINELSIEYPVYTLQGNGGGIYIEENYRYGAHVLNEKDKEVLLKILEGLPDDEKTVLNAIIQTLS